MVPRNKSDTWEPFHFTEIEDESRCLSIMVSVPKGAVYKLQSYFNNIQCSFKSFPSNLAMFRLTLVNKPAVTMTVTKIIYFAQSQKEARDGKEK